MLFLSLFFSQAKAQDTTNVFGLREKTMMLPHVVKPYNFDLSLGVLFTRVPFDWVETALEVPLFNMHAAFGLPKGFSIEGDFTTLLITNELRLGPRWNFQHNNFSFKIGIDGEIAHGRLDFFGYNGGKMTGGFLYPTIAVGYLIKNEVALSLHFELNEMLGLTGVVEDLSAVSYPAMFNGGTLALYSEQRYWKDHVCTIGVKLACLKYFFPAWAAYPTFDRFYLLPQFSLNFEI